MWEFGISVCTTCINYGFQLFDYLSDAIPGMAAGLITLVCLSVGYRALVRPAIAGRLGGLIAGASDSVKPYLKRSGGTGNFTDNKRS